MLTDKGLQDNKLKLFGVDSTRNLWELLNMCIEVDKVREFSQADNK